MFAKVENWRAEISYFLWGIENPSQPKKDSFFFSIAGETFTSLGEHFLKLLEDLRKITKVIKNFRFAKIPSNFFGEKNKNRDFLT